MGARALRVVRNLLAALGLVGLLVTFTPILRPCVLALAGPWNTPRGDVLIALGGAGSGELAIGLGSYWRAVYAVKAFREGGFREIIVSGGGGAPSVAEQIQDFLVYSGVPPTVIRLESQSRSTHENALFTRRILGSTPGRKVLLTSDLHMFRAIRTFRKAGLDVMPSPVPDAIKRCNSMRTRWSVFVALIEEIGGIGYYYARGWM